MLTATDLVYITRVATIPLVSSSIGLFYAVNETTTFLSFHRAAKADEPSVSRSLRLWWRSFLVPGLVQIFAIGITNLVGGVLTARALNAAGKSYCLAASGIFFGLLHFAFGPKIAATIEKIADEDQERSGETLEWQQQWLKIHYARTLVADIPCFLSYFVAFLVI